MVRVRFLVEKYVEILLNMKKYKIILVAGARPNFMKIAPLMHALKDHPTIDAVLVHTGQHYDEKMSHSFLINSISQSHKSISKLVRAPTRYRRPASWKALSKFVLMRNQI